MAEPIRTYNWPDFSRVSETLALQVLPMASGRKYLYLAGGDGQPEIARRLGFQRTRNGLWVRETEGGLRLDRDLIQRWRAVLGDRFTFSRKTAEEIVNKEGLRRSRIQALLSQSTYLGLNRRGQEVYEGLDGRFVRNPRGWKTISEKQMAEDDSLTPDAFLRYDPTDPLSLRRCAEGLILEIAGGRTIRQDEMLRFVRAIHDDPALTREAPAYRDALRAVEDVVARHVARFDGKTINVYQEAQRFHEGFSLPATGGRGLAAPLAVLANRLLGNQAELQEARISATLTGNGAALHRLPRNVTLKASVVDEAARDRVATLARALAPSLDVVENNPDVHEGSDFTFAEFAGSRLEEPADRDGLLLTTDTQVGLLDTLERRAADGRSVFVFPEPATAGEWSRLNEVLGHVATQWFVEGGVQVDSTLTGGHPGEPNTIMLVVGPKRVEPQLTEAPDLATLSDFSSLWSWSSEVIAHRQTLAEELRLHRGRLQARQAGLDAGLVQGGEEEQPAFEDGNEFQVPYIAAAHYEPPGDKTWEPTAMMPRFQQAAMNDALRELARRRGNVVEWVARELNWTVDELVEVASPEQVDAVSLEIDARLRDGQSLIIADQTGLGKGRTAALLIRWSVLRDEPVVFATKNEKLFTDIWRDLRDVRSDHLINPLILNSSSRVVDPDTGEELFRSPDREIMQDIMEDVVNNDAPLPAGVNLILMAYSQVNQKAAKSLRFKFLERIMPMARFYLDESHEAAGEGNTGINVRALVKIARHVTYSSATWAKRIKSLPVYERALPRNMTPENLQEVLRKGGVSVLEAMTTMMAKAGRLIRREIDLSQIEFISHVDTTHRERNRAYAATLAPVLAAMNFLSGDVDTLVSRINAQTARRLEELRGQGRRVPNIRALEATRNGFGSDHYQLSRLFTFAIKADALVEQSLAAIQRNEKPIIVVENTAVDYLREVLQGEDLEGMPDYKQALRRVLDRMTRFRNPRNRSNPNADASEMSEEIRAAREDILAMIDELPDLPLSPIDVVKNALALQGYSCGELTGRTLEYSADGEITNRGRQDRNELTRQFQNGELDAMIIGKPAFAGISLHADARVEDQRQRCLIFGQTPADIADFMQVLGRAHRKNQVIGPRVMWIDSGLPVEAKFSMLLEAHLQRLSANCTSNRESNASRSGEIPDIFNRVGQAVCRRFIELNPDIAAQLNLGEIDDEAEERAENDERTENMWAQKLMSYINLLHPDVQERILNDIFAEFQAEIEELDAKNENPLRAKALPGSWRILEQRLFDGVENSMSIENEPVYLTRIEGERIVNPLRSPDVEDLVDAAEARLAQAQTSSEQIVVGHSVYRDPTDCALALHRNKMPALERLLERNDRYATLEDALQSDEANPIRTMADTFDRRIALLRKLKPGVEITLTDEDTGVRSRGIITDILCPQEGHEDKFSQYRLTFVQARNDAPRRMSLAALMADENFDIKRGLKGPDREEILASFDRAPEGRFKVQKWLLTNNPLRAMQLSNEQETPLGQMVAFETENGMIHRGLLLKRPDILRDVVPAQIPHPTAAVDFLVSGRGTWLRSVSSLKTTMGVTITPKGSGNGRHYRLQLPNPNKQGCEIYDHPYFQAMLAEARQHNLVKQGRPVFQLTEPLLREVITQAYDAGVRFYVEARDREWVNEWMQSHQAEVNAASMAEQQAEAALTALLVPGGVANSVIPVDGEEVAPPETEGPTAAVA